MGLFSLLNFYLMKWLCKLFGHSFSTVDLLTYQLEKEGRCFTLNLITRELRPSTRKPHLKCRRCGQQIE